jgi:uncharacterized membrane protein YdbT with pleckstrin-like domain
VDPEPGEQVFFHGHPSWLSMLSFHVRGLVLTILAGAIAGLVTALVVGHVQVGWIVLVVFVGLLLVIAVGFVRRVSTRYTITNQRLTIEHGLLSRDLHHTRLERVQNVNLRQSMWERVLRIGTVDFDTASESGYDFSFVGVSHPHGIVRTVDRALRELRHESPAPDALGQP